LKEPLGLGIDQNIIVNLVAWIPPTLTGTYKEPLHFSLPHYILSANSLTTSLVALNCLMEKNYPTKEFLDSTIVVAIE